MKRQHIGIAVGLLGNFMFGWGLYHLMGIGSCGGPYAPCPGSAWVYFVALPVGIIVSILSIFVGGGLIFLTTFGAVGVASILRGVNGGVGGDGDTTFPYVFGGLFLAPVLLPLLFVPFGKRSKRRKAWLRAQGKKAVATVTAVDDTGVTVNQNPGVRLKLSIQPNNGEPAFEGEHLTVVSRVDLPRVGDTYPVWYDPRDTSKFDVGNRIAAAEPPPAPEPEASERPTGWVTELAKLNDLRLAGALTDEEFTKAKDRLLAGSPREPAA